VQKRFHLGHDSQRAARAVLDLDLEQIWESNAWLFEYQPGEAVWIDYYLWVAEHVARGQYEIVLPIDRRETRGSFDPAHSYAKYFSFFQSIFPLVRFVPEDGAFLAAGQQAAADEAAELGASADFLSGLAEISAAAAEITPPTDRGPMLHAVIDAYADYLASRHVKGAEVQAAHARQIKEAIADRPLPDVGRDALNEITAYWASRPEARVRGGRKSGRPISVQTVMNMLKTARRFFRWVDESENYDWDLPKGGLSILQVDRRTLITSDELAELSEGVKVFTVDELATLYRVGDDLDRLTLLLGLNTGAVHAEISTMMQSEIKRDTDPPVMRRLRGKSHVPGQWPLWPETIQAIDNHLAHRDDDYPNLVVARRTRQPLAPKASQSAWTRLMARAREQKPNIQRLGFKHVRKTAAQMVRWASDGELAGVFLQHGDTVATDDLASVYSNPNFARLSEVVTDMREQLRPMFDSV